jgi:cytochrome c biogenesis protein CcdA
MEQNFWYPKLFSRKNPTKNSRRCTGFWIVLFFFMMVPFVLGTDLLFFYEKGCPQCAQIFDFLNHRIKPVYDIQIKTYEIHDPENARLMMALAEQYNAEEIIKKGTPAVFVGNKAFHGYSRLVQRQIEESIRNALRNNVDTPLNRISETAVKEDVLKKVTLPVLIGAAAVDAVNPCAFAVLALLLGTILLAASRERKIVLQAGLAFTAACFISYFLIGLGLFTAVQAVGIQHYVYTSVSILALLIGLWNIKDSIWKDKGPSIGVPKSWQPYVKRLISGVISVPGSFFIGLLVSLFLLPCTSGPYVVIIGMLSSTATRIQAFWLLALYNLIFIVPFIVITLSVSVGATTPARVEKWRQEKLRIIHFWAGMFLFLLGIALIIFLITGKI